MLLTPPRSSSQRAGLPFESRDHVEDSPLSLKGKGKQLRGDEDDESVRPLSSASRRSKTDTSSQDIDENTDGRPSMADTIQSFSERLFEDLIPQVQSVEALCKKQQKTLDLRQKKIVELQSTIQQ